MRNLGIFTTSLAVGMLVFAGCEQASPQQVLEESASSSLTATTVQYEAESAALSGGASKNTNHSGYSGAGFVDGFFNSSTAQVSFSVSVASAGSYSLTLHYSAGNGTSSNTGLYVNGTRIKAVTFNATSSWDAWSDETETVSLNAGSNTVVYKAETSSSSCINLDKLTVSPNAGLTVSPLSLNFGSVVVGATAQLSSNVRNTSAATVPPPTLTLGGANADQFWFNPGLPSCTTSNALPPLAGGCDAIVMFQPTSVGTKTATVTVAGQTISLMGVATAVTLSVSPLSLNFGSVAVGATQQLSSNVRNTSAVTVPAPTLTLSGTNADQFWLDPSLPSCSTSNSLPPLAGGCDAIVVFKPTSAGTKTATVTVAGQTISLTGVGTPVTYEAEGAILSGGASKNTNHNGYSGTGFVDGYCNSITAQTSFAVIVGSAGGYGLTLRYSAGNGTSSNTGLYVNGSRIKSVVFNITPSWDTWSDETETVPLNAGSNTIAYKAETSSGSCINLDKLTVLSTGGLTVSPLSLNFGSVVVGTTAQLSSTVRNTTAVTVPPPTLTLGGANADQFWFNPGLPSCTISNALPPLAGGCDAIVMFQPTSVGTKTATVTVAGQTISLMGVATAVTLSVSPLSLNFGSVAVGATQQLSSNVRNTSAVTVPAPTLTLSGTNADQFWLDPSLPSCSTSNSLPPLAGGCDAIVVFKPTSAGTKTATVTVAGQTISLTGVGTPVTYEAESAILSGGASKNTNHSGYSGTGFVDGFFNSTTAQTSFAVIVGSAGSYGLTLRYSAGNGTSSNTGLYVNGSRIKSVVFNITPSWDTWSDETETVPLNAGSNTIAYKAETSSGSCINLDKLTVLSTGGLTVSPLSLNFGSVVVGTTAQLSSTVRNTTAVTVPPPTLTLGGANADQFWFNPGLPSCTTSNALPPLAGGCDAIVMFQPISVGTKTATVTVAGQTISLIGVGL